MGGGADEWKEGLVSWGSVRGCGCVRLWSDAVVRRGMLSPSSSGTAKPQLTSNKSLELQSAFKADLEELSRIC